MTESLKSSELSNFDENTEIILSSMTQIIRELEINNYVKKFTFEFFELAEELINDNELLKMNESLIVKVKNRFKEIRNKKEIITRAKKTKTKFIKQDSFDFEHVEVSFRRDDRDDRDERDNKEIKKFFVADTAAIMKADIQTIEKTSAIIDRDVQAILIKAEVKTKTKRATILTRAEVKAKTNINASNNLIVNIDKTIINVSSNKKFKTFIIDEEIMKEVMNIFN